MWCSCLGAERSLLIMWITLQLWRFGWLPGQGGGAYQVVAGNFVGLQNLPRSRLSKPWIDSEEADRLGKGVGISGLCGVLRLSNMRRMHSDWQVPLHHGWIPRWIRFWSAYRFSWWDSADGWVWLVSLHSSPLFKEMEGLVCQACFFQWLNSTEEVRRKVVAWEIVKEFWLLKVVILVVPDVSCDVSWSISCPESFFPQLILSQERIGFVGFVDFRIGSVSCNEPLSNHSSGLLWGWPWWRYHIDMNCAFQVRRIDLSYHLKSWASRHSLIHVPILSSSSSAGAVRVVVIPWSKYLPQFLVTLLDPL